MKLVLATKNKGKIKEFRAAFEKLGYEVLSLDDFGHIEEPVEDGKTFEENAKLKATYYMKATGCAALADDSGLAVDALGGAPGVYSARFAGPQHNDADNNAKLIRDLEGKENRHAQYVCVLTVAFPDGTYKVAKGTCEGYIQDEPVGDGGFGYDPYFYVPQYKTTMANVTMEEKYAISHRGKALRVLLEGWDA